MRRREFLAGATAMAAATAVGRTVVRAQTARQPDPAKLARIAIMTLDFQGMLKLPTQPASPNRTLDVLDIPQMLADTYGVHNVEYQHTHIVSTEPSYLRDLRASLDKSKSRMSNLNLEFGTLNISAPDAADRAAAIAQTRTWVDYALILGTPRVMINQGTLTEESKVWAVPALKEMVDYGRSKGVKVSVETRLTFGGGRGGRGRAGGAAPAGGRVGAPAGTAAVPGAATAPATPGTAPAAPVTPPALRCRRRTPRRPVHQGRTLPRSRPPWR